MATEKDNTKANTSSATISMERCGARRVTMFFHLRLLGVVTLLADTEIPRLTVEQIAGSSHLRWGCAGNAGLAEGPSLVVRRGARWTGGGLCRWCARRPVVGR